MIPQINEKWYIKHAGAMGVIGYTIVDITEKTVLLKKLDSIVYNNASRYCISDIEFIEKIEKLKEK